MAVKNKEVWLFTSIEDASKNTKIDLKNIQKALLSKKEDINGFKWKFVGISGKEVESIIFDEIKENPELLT